MGEVGVETAVSADIAPTIAHSAGAPLYFSPWDDQARLIGHAVDKANEMEAIIADIGEQFASAAAARPELAGKQVVFLKNGISDGNAIACRTDSAPSS